MADSIFEALDTALTESRPVVLATAVAGSQLGAKVLLAVGEGTERVTDRLSTGWTDAGLEATVERDAEAAAHDHRPRRVMALAVRTGAGQHEHGSVGPELGRDVLGVVADRGDLHVGGDADAELHRVTVGPASGLLSPEPLVVGNLGRAVELLFVLAGVVGGVRAGVVRERVGGDEVASPHVGGIETGLGREEVGGSLERGGGLGSARAAEGADGGGRGEHASVGRGLPRS